MGRSREEVAFYGKFPKTGTAIQAHALREKS